MKNVFFVCCVMLLIFFVSGVAFCYEVADVLQFPTENYSRNDNILGAYNKVGNGKYHLGEDAETAAETRVLSIGNGKVKYAKNHPSRYDSDGKLIKNYGGIYIIEHTLAYGEKICSLYAHLNFGSFVKNEGDDVSKGEYLGQVGTTAQNGGWSEHLHLGILKGAYPANPNEYICGDWIFSGYSSCESTVNSWYDPTSLINPRFRRLANVAWSPTNRSCLYADRWVFYSQGYPNGPQCVDSFICQQEEHEMMMSLEGGFFSNWWNIIYSPSDIVETESCNQ